MWRLVNGLVSACALQEQFYTEGCCNRDRDVGGERVGVATIVQPECILSQLNCTKDDVIYILKKSLSSHTVAHE